MQPSEIPLPAATASDHPGRGSRMTSIERGDGVGIEYTRELLRGVRLAHDAAGAVAAAEVPMRHTDDDRSTLDAFIRLRAELGNPNLPTRIATFPAGSSMQRIEVTSRTGPELNAVRADVERRYGAASTVLVDRGARRWMQVLHWDPTRLRHLEDLAERAGFIDVTFDPSPVALARVCEPSTTFAQRAAATDDTYIVAFDHGVPVAAASVSTVGHIHPDLSTGHVPFSVEMFDELAEPTVILQQLSAVDREQPRDDGIDLLVAGEAYAPYPPHDLRAPERQCVALGAAVGAAGLAGRLRPVDIIAGSGTAAINQPRPWAIERVSSLPPPDEAASPGSLRRLSARLRPRRSP